MKIDVRRAADLYRIAAGGGSGTAMCKLGVLYEEGKLDGTSNHAKAMEWYLKAAEKQEVPAYAAIAWMYAQGLGVERDFRKAYEWTEKAAREDDPWAQNVLGCLLLDYRSGREVDARAEMWFRLAARNGYALGEANLGHMYLTGWYLENDFEKAFEHLSKALLLDRQDNRWIQETFASIWEKRTTEERARLKLLLKSLMEKPELIENPGHQAAQVLTIAISRYSKTSEFDRDIRAFIKRLEESSNQPAKLVLSWCAFTGMHMPYDLEKARRLALAVPDERDRECLLAIYDSVAAPTTEEQMSARRSLRKLADEGHRRAAEVMAVRSGLGEGTRYDPDAMIKYYNISKGLTEPADRVTFAPEVYKRLQIRQVPFEPAPAKETVVSQEVPGVASRQPAVFRKMQPNYPKDLKLSGVSGEVLVEFVVDCGGYVRDPVVMNATHPLFAAAAKAAILRWRFHPGVKDGRTVAARMQQPFEFEIVGEDEEITLESIVRSRAAILPGAVRR